jgi:tetratricopeptide (TPR) repeat protein
VPGAEKNLLKMAAEEKSPLWRAVAVNLLRASAHEPGVNEALLAATNDSSDLVRSMATRALGELEPAANVAARLPALLDDPSRAVRIDAAWALRRSVDEHSRAGSELMHYLEFNRDQPVGLTQWASYLQDRGDATGALAAFRLAVDWDGGSAPLRSNYAIALNLAGQAEEAAKQLGEAMRLAPRDAQMRYTYALALNEVGRESEARAELEQAVQIEPRFARAWYNLGLARNAAGQTEQALEALARAEALDPRNAQAPYAAATILMRLGHVGEAAEAAQRALAIDPHYAEAAELLRTLSRP